MQHMLTETNTLSLHLMHMNSWFVGPVNTKEIFIMIIVVLDLFKEGVAIEVVYVIEQCYYNNNIMVTQVIVYWFQVEMEIQSMSNFMYVRNRLILLSIDKITTTIINSKDKVMVKMAQVFQVSVGNSQTEYQDTIPCTCILL